MTIGFGFSSGKDAMMPNASSMFASWFWMPRRTWPSTKVGRPLAWKETKSIGVPILPVAKFVPRSWCSKKSRENWPPGPAVSGPPTRAVGSARRTPSMA